MNSLDASVIAFFNQFLHRSWAFDHFAHFLSYTNLVKGVVIMTMFWWAWFMNRDDERSAQIRKHLIATLIAAVVAIVVARTLSLTLPFRLRPALNPNIGFVLSYVELPPIRLFSSFPSDSAIVFFALATGLFFVSRKMGLFALFHAAFIVCLPRLYLGFHYLTDIVAGAFIGFCISWFINTTSWTDAVTRLCLRVERTKPALFYACFFLMTYLVGDMFEELLRMGGKALILFGHLSG